MWRKALCIVLSFSSLVWAGHVALLGPLVSTGGDTYKAFIVASGIHQSDAELAVLLNCNGYHSKKIFSLGNTDFEPMEVEFKIPFAELGACQLYSVVKESNRKGTYCSKDEIHIENKKDSFILIQTDKPVYKPGDKLTYQVIALNSETKPVPYNNIEIEMRDGKQNLVLSTKNNVTKFDFGFHQSQIWLADEPNLGTWTLKASIAELNSSVTKTFQVNHYTLPSFKFYIETTPKISFDEKDIELNFFAKYSFDEFVKGKVSIVASVRSELNPKIVIHTFEKTIDINRDRNLFKINLKKDLLIKFMVKNVIVAIEAEFEEANTGVKSVESRQVLIFPQGKHIINVDRKEKFRPGFPFKVKVDVTTFDGLREESESIPVTLRQKYEYEDNQYGQNAEISSVAFLKNGSTQIILYPAENAKSLQLTVIYDESKISDVVGKIEHSKADEFFQALVLTENPIIGETMDISIQSNSILETLNLVVFGKSGIVYSNTYDEFEDDHHTNISLKLTEEMAPTANIIIFYLRENDGVMIYDQLDLNLGFLASNFLSLDSSTSTKRIRQNIQIDATTQPGSLIGLLAVDQSVAYMGTENVISHDDVAFKLYPDISVYPYQKGDKRFAFGNINAFKISPTSEKKRLCYKNEEMLFNSDGIAAVSGIEWIDEGPTDEIISPEDIPRRNFPEVWFQDVKEVVDGSYTFYKKLPDSITTWIVNGFSINPDHGFAVADPVKIKVFQDFFIRIEKPHFVKLNEDVTIKVIIHNFLEKNVTTTVTLKNVANMFKIIDGKEAKSFLDKTLTTLVESHATAIAIFRVRANEAGKAVFEVKASTDSAEDTVEEYFTVNAPGITKHETRAVVIDLNNATSFEGNMTFEVVDAVPGSVTYEIVTSSDLLGPALNNVGNLISLPEGCGEQKMRIISSTIMAIKYLKATSHLTIADEQNFDRILTRSYQDLIALQNGDGSFDLWNTNHKADYWRSFSNWANPKDYLDLTAYIVKLLSELETVKPILDKNVISKAMKYIASKQKYDGRFERGEGAQFRDLKQYSNIEGVSLTAYILIGILENESLKTSYPDIANNALSFIEKNYYDILHGGTNYERALTFYIYALTGKNHTTLMLNKLRNESLKSKKGVYWNLRSRTISSPAVQVEISSYVVLGLAKLKHYEEANEIIKFLMSQKNPKGGFASTTDTVLGLQALAEVSKVFDSKDTRMDLVLKNDLGEEVQMLVTKVQKRSTYKTLSPSTTSVTINATGHGIASLQVSCTYKKKIQGYKLHFDLTVRASKGRDNLLKLKICASTKKRQKSNMAIVEIEMPSGYTHHSGPNLDDGEIKKVTRLDDGARLLVYLGEVSSTKICLSDIEAVQTSQVGSLRDSEVKIYDYYEPEKIAIEYYKFI